MKKLLIVLADPQEQFLKQLVLKFAEAFSGQAELAAFSEKEAFESYASRPRQADLFLIAEEFSELSGGQLSGGRFPSTTLSEGRFQMTANLTGERFLLTSDIVRGTVSNIVRGTVPDDRLVRGMISNDSKIDRETGSAGAEPSELSGELSEEQFRLTDQTPAGTWRRLCRFDGAEQILREVLALCPELGPGNARLKKKTETVIFYSASGGTGRTTAALGTAAALAAPGKRVLYLDAEPLQTCGYLLRDPEVLSDPEVFVRLSEPGYDPWMLLKPFVKHRGFDYLPPFEAPLAALDFSMELWKRILLSAAASEEYDLILADTDARYDREKAELFSCSERIVFVTSENGAALFAQERLLPFLDPADRKKMICVLNRVSDGRKDAEAVKPSGSGAAEAGEPAGDKAVKAADSAGRRSAVPGEGAAPGEAAVCIPVLPEAEGLTPEELSGKNGFRKLAFLLLSV